MSRTLSYAMPKKRQFGGMIGATPQTSTPIGSVANPTKLQVGGDTQGTPMLKNPFARPVFVSDPNSPFPPSQEQQKGNAYYQALNKQYAQSGDQANALRAKGMYAPLTQQEGAQAKANNYQRMMDMAAQEGQLQGIKAGAAEKAAKMASGGGGNPYGKLEHGGYAQGPPTHMDLGGTVTTGGFSQFNKPKMVGTSVQHMEKGGYVHGPQPPHALAYGGKNIASPIHAERGAGSRESLLPAPEDIGGGKAEGWIGGGNQGRLRKVITGGYGAQPARAGRIGYRGTLQARPESGGSPSGLAGFYAKQNALGQKNAARQGIDPVTGMSYTPTDREVMDQLNMVGKKYGPAERAMLSDYYQAGRTGDFAKRAAAEASIKKRRDEIAGKQPQIPDALKRREPQVPDYFGNAMNAAKNMPATNNVMAGQSIGQMAQFAGPTPQNYADNPMKLAQGGYNKSTPIEVAPTNTGGQNPDGIPVKDAMAKLASGGNTAPVKPYIVNEKGEEAWQPDGEKPQLMPGKEKMVLFPKDGKVIPHGRTMEMAKKGKVEMPEHRVVGGNTDKSGDDDAKGGLAKRETYAQRKEKAKQASLRQFDKQLAEKMKKEDIDLLRKSILEDTAFPTGVLTNAPQMMGGLGTAYQAPVEEYQPPLQALYSINPEFRKQLPTYAEVGGELPEAYLKSWATMQPESAQQVAPEVEDELDKLTYQDLTPEVAAPNALQVPEMLKRPEPAIPDYLGNALASAKDLPKVSSVTTPEKIKAQTGYTPEEMELLAQGQEMTSRGVSQMGPSGVKFASGGGIENGKAFGPHVIPEQKPVTIRPGKVKDELGDVGTRLAKQKEEKEFMERWENDLNKEGGRTKSFA